MSESMRRAISLGTKRSNAQRSHQRRLKRRRSSSKSKRRSRYAYLPKKYTPKRGRRACHARYGKQYIRVGCGTSKLHGKGIVRCCRRRSSSRGKKRNKSNVPPTTKQIDAALKKTVNKGLAQAEKGHPKAALKSFNKANQMAQAKAQVRRSSRPSQKPVRYR